MIDGQKRPNLLKIDFYFQNRKYYFILYVKNTFKKYFAEAFSKYFFKVFNYKTSQSLLIVGLYPDIISV